MYNSGTHKQKRPHEILTHDYSNNIKDVSCKEKTRRGITEEKGPHNVSGVKARQNQWGKPKCSRVQAVLCKNIKRRYEKKSNQISKNRHKCEYEGICTYTSNALQPLTVQQTLAQRANNSPQAVKKTVLTQFIALADRPLCVIDNVLEPYQRFAISWKSMSVAYCMTRLHWDNTVVFVFMWVGVTLGQYFFAPRPVTIKKEYH